MAICAGGLREYLLAHDALPDRPLRAMVPVSIRTGEEADPWTNRVSAIVADLPTDCDDPLERVARCRAAMLDAKRLLDLVPADELVDMTQFSAPVLATAAVRLASRLRLADRVAQPFNLVISNVPGPRQPLYLRRGAAVSPVPGVDRHRRAGPQHHRRQLSGPARLRFHRRPRTRAGRVGSGGHAHRRDRPAVRRQRR